VGISAESLRAFGTTASASLRVGFGCVGCGRALGSAGGAVALGGEGSGPGAIAVAGGATGSSALPPQRRVIGRVTIGQEPPPNAPSASGRSDFFRGIGVTTCWSGDGNDSPSGAG